MGGRAERARRLGGRLVGPTLGVLLLATCEGRPAGPGPPPEAELTVRSTSAHGVYFHSPGDRVSVGSQEAYYVWLLDRLGLEPDRPLVYFKYRDRIQMRRLTGRDANGWAELGTGRFHTIWSFDNHEAVHALVSSEWNAAPALMNEGMATAHQTAPHIGMLEPAWSGTPIDTLAARALREGKMPPLESLLESRDFRQYDDAFSYPIAGSFVKSVIERHGYDAIARFFRNSDYRDSAGRLRSTFREAFGEEIEDAWREWLEGL